MKKFILIIFLIVCQFNVLAQTKIYSTNEYQFNVGRTIPLKDGSYQYFYIFQSKDTFLRAEGEIVNNKKQGFWNIYEFGKKVEETFYENDWKHGMERSFYESGNVKSIQNYNYGNRIGTVSYFKNGQIESYSCKSFSREYYYNGRIKYESINESDSVGITYNFIGLCGGWEFFIQAILDKDKPFLGNEWYENGNKKVSSKLVKRTPYTLEITQFDSLERKVIVGKIEHTTRENIKCFYMVGDWIYYNTKGDIEKVITHKSYH
jgi:antitoxin component YwqK of YwqJK toxin-antitoxin module